MDHVDDISRPQPSAVALFCRGLGQRYQRLLDSVTPFVAGRWFFCVFMMAAFLLRIFLLQGWYIVTYALAIYHLNLFISFLTPKIDPALADDFDDGDPGLPTKSNEEFRPFIRRLPEFHFWYSATKATLIAFICTFFETFNIPVFWPILLLYFITLFVLTMKKQIKHMIKYRYIPFSVGKQKYKPRTQAESATSFLSNTDLAGPRGTSNHPPQHSTAHHLFQGPQPSPPPQQMQHPRNESL
ncbi:protein RER1-like [Tropilaelaps mercedesae]|uniref:Protein RER1-like n=1 Tax=Tropilaelaps mercedesae TaxID=418985 RepID=A0A1V9XL62_9ACAR|nr:protein RER1-like [Tropilaelaps mercedesae]